MVAARGRARWPSTATARSRRSRGSADVLEALGVAIAAPTPEVVERCLRRGRHRLPVRAALPRGDAPRGGAAQRARHAHDVQPARAADQPGRGAPPRRRRLRRRARELMARALGRLGSPARAGGPRRRRPRRGRPRRGDRGRRARGRRGHAATSSRRATSASTRGPGRAGRRRRAGTTRDRPGHARTAQARRAARNAALMTRGGGALRRRAAPRLRRRRRGRAAGTRRRRGAGAVLETLRTKRRARQDGA